MKKKLKALVAMMSLCALGTVGSAFALTRNQAKATGTVGHYDQAVYLYWAEGVDSEVALTPCDSLNSTESQYRFLTVSPKTTKTVAGSIKLDFELSVSQGNYHLDGLTVEVYKTLTANDSTLTGAEKKATLTGGKGGVGVALQGTTSFDISGTSTVAYYTFKVSYDGSSVAGKTLGGTMTIAQSYVAPAVAA